MWTIPRSRFAMLSAPLALAACAAGEWKAVDHRLNLASQPARGKGYAPLPGRHNDFGSFDGAGGYTWTITLPRGAAIIIGAACSDDCPRLDFVVTGPGLAAPLADTVAGPVPLLELVAADSGAYQVQLSWDACRGERCWWVGQAYGKTR